MEIYKKLLELFNSRKNVYAEAYYDNNSKRYAYRSIKKPISVEILKRHCTDNKYLGIGIYPLFSNNKCQWVAADFDIHNDEEKEEVDIAIKKILEIADGIDLHIYMEYSKSGNGIHLWLFFSEPIDSWKARKLMMGLIESAGASKLSSMDRLFPSQDRLSNESKGLGNLIHMPFSAMFCDNGGTIFKDRDGTIFTNSEDDMEAWLGTVEKNDLKYVERILNDWGIHQNNVDVDKYETDNIEYQYADNGLDRVLKDPFIKWCNDFPRKVCYNAWIALITNLLPFGENGKKAIHNISRLDSERYDPDLTDSKINDFSKFKPITYQWIIDNARYKEIPNITYKSPAAAGMVSQLMVFEKFGQYYIKVKGKESKRITNFTLIPNKIIISKEKIIHDFDIQTKERRLKNKLIPADDLSKLDKFRTLLVNTSNDILFFGNQNDIFHLIEYINKSYPSTPKVIGKSAIGLHKVENNQWAVLTQSQAWANEGAVANLEYWNVSGEKQINMSNDVDISKDTIINIRKTLLAFNSFHITSGIVGWMVAALVKERLFKKYKLRFPVLIIHGQAGSGKTETIRHIVKRFFCDDGQIFSVGDLTKFVSLNLTGTSNTFPLYLDEYKPSKMLPAQRDYISQMVRTLYDQSSAARGRADQTISQYPMIAPVVLIGEEGFTEPALVERSIDIFMSKAESTEYTDEFKNLIKEPLGKLGNSLLNWTLSISDAELIDIYQNEINIKGSDRVEENIAIVNLGLELLEIFFKSKEVVFPLSSSKKIFREKQLNLLKETGHTKTVVDQMVEQILTMHSIEKIEKNIVEVRDTEVLIYVNGALPVLRQWAKNTGYDGELLSNYEFNKQLRSSEYYEGTSNRRLEEKQRKVKVLKAAKLQEMGLMDVNWEPTATVDTGISKQCSII